MEWSGQVVRGGVGWTGLAWVGMVWAGLEGPGLAIDEVGHSAHIISRMLISPRLFGPNGIPSACFISVSNCPFIVFGMSMLILAVQ